MPDPNKTELAEFCALPVPVNTPFNVQFPTVCAEQELLTRSRERTRQKISRYKQEDSLYVIKALILFSNMFIFMRYTGHHRYWSKHLVNAKSYHLLLNLYQLRCNP